MKEKTDDEILSEIMLVNEKLDEILIELRKKNEVAAPKADTGAQMSIDTGEAK